MGPDARAAELHELLHGVLEVRFALVHQRIEALVGRPVWTHEIGLNADGLVQEARDQQHPTIRGIVEQVARVKPTIVVVDALTAPREYVEAEDDEDGEYDDADGDF